MSGTWTPSSELESLTDAACRGALDEQGATRLALLLRDEEACRWYRDYCLLQVELRFLAMADRIDTAARNNTRWELEFDGAGRSRTRGAEVQEPPPVIVVSPLSPLQPSPFSLQSLSASVLFSYAAATIILGAALLTIWAYRISPDVLFVRDRLRPSEIRENAPPLPAEVVGQITGMVDCRWRDPTIGDFNRDQVPLGRRYALDSGFLEITYHAGAKVILHGPCTYEVESKNGGYLSFGKLTARVEGKTPGRSASSNSQISTLNAQLFSVRTPTAVVTDLGTEFGVEVDRSGTSRAHVFQGRIEVRRTGGAPIRDVTALGENESVTVASGGGPVVKATRHPSASGFVRDMPRRTRIKLFNTGVGLKEGNTDPHWQLVARSDYPHVKPQPAVVSAVDPSHYLPNNPDQSQWISTAGDLPALPSGVFTFRTTFELADVVTRSVVLMGRFLADNHVNAIRLNGQAVSVPEHGVGPPFDQFHSFTARQGFVQGKNVLEIDVYNYAGMSGKGTPMVLLVELEGFALRDGHGSPALPKK